MKVLLTYGIGPYKYDKFLYFSDNTSKLDVELECSRFVQSKFVQSKIDWTYKIMLEENK